MPARKSASRQHKGDGDKERPLPGIEISSKDDLPESRKLSAKIHIPEITDSEVVDLALDTIRKGKQALVFAGTKRSAEKAAEDIAAKIKKEAITNSNSLYTLSEKAKAALSHPTVQCERLADSLLKGIAFHHSGLVSEQRALIESAFKDGTVKIICCTPTLAYGVDLPAFRVIIKDLKRYGHHGLAWIPVMDYQQICGRAGRPKYDNLGEAICVLSGDKDRDEIIERFINGDPEDVVSKLAVEPVLRTAILSLIATRFVTDRASLTEFFSGTFWAQQYGDLAKLDKIIEKMLILLEDYEFIVYKGEDARKDRARDSERWRKDADDGSANDSKEISWDQSVDDAFISAKEITESIERRASGKLTATALGERVAQLYIDPLTAHNIIIALGRAGSKQVTEYSFLQLVSCCLELRPLLRVKQSEIEKMTAELVERESLHITLEPSVYDPEHDDFMDSVKTALFFEEWMEEHDEEYLLEKYSVRPGEIRVKLERADWLLYSAEELAKLLKRQPILKTLLKARYRLKYGVKEELLSLLRLQGVGRVRARRLYNSGLKDLGAIKKSDISSLVQLMGKSVAISIKKQVGEDVDRIVVPENRRKGQVSLKDFDTG